MLVVGSAARIPADPTTATNHTTMAGDHDIYRNALRVIASLPPAEMSSAGWVEKANLDMAREAAARALFHGVTVSECPATYGGYRCQLEAGHGGDHVHTLMLRPGMSSTTHWRDDDIAACPATTRFGERCQRDNGHDGDHLHTSGADGRSVSWAEDR